VSSVRRNWTEGGTHEERSRAESARRDEPEVVAAGGVDEEEEATEVTVVSVTDTVVRPRTCAESKRSKGKKREKRKRKNGDEQ
jgi:hypothetical protein